MRKKLLLTLLMCIVSLMGVLVLGAQDTAREDAFSGAVKSIMEKYSTSLLASDSDAWITLWDDNAVKLPTHDSMIEGKEHIKRNIESSLRIFTYDIFDIQITATHVDNNLGYVFGNYKYAYTYRSSGVRTDRSGKYVTILKKQEDGNWKIVLDYSSLNY
jgi:ketosteroid isomerase-like protein